MIPIDNDTGMAIVQALKAFDSSMWILGPLICCAIIFNGCMS